MPPSSSNNPATGHEIKREMLLPGRAQYEQAQARSPVTVLFDPQKPKRAIVYELCGYRVDRPEEIAAGLA